MKNSETVIESIGLIKSYGQFRAINGLDLSVKRGETLGLIGPNGSGKTTFIRVLTGITTFNSGSVKVLGCDLPDHSIMPRIGYMTQKEAIYNELTVRENLRFFATIYGIRGSKRDKRIDEVIDIVELGEHPHFLAGQLSGGLRQRLSLAIALVHEPEVLVLDEPTVGVDPELRISFWDHFLELNKSGITILITTHNMDEARRASRLAMIRNGAVIATGTADEISSQAGTNDLEKAFLHFSGASPEDGGAE